MSEQSPKQAWWPRFAILAAVTAGGTWAATDAGLFASRTPAEVVWMSDLDAASALARDEGKRLLVDFAADWCRPCKRLEAEVFSTEKFAAAMEERYVAVRVDATHVRDGTRVADLLRKYGVTAYPTVLVIDPGSGRKLGTSVGFVRVGTMVAFLDSHAG